MTDSQTLTTSQTLARLWQVIRPNSGYLFLSILMSASVSAIMLFAMERVGATCDLILADAPASVFWPNALLLIVLFAAISVVTLIQIYTMAIVGQRLANDLRSALFSKMTDLPMAYFDAHTTGDLMSRMTNDIDQINTSFSDNLTSVVEAVVNVIGTFIALGCHRFSAVLHSHSHCLAHFQKALRQLPAQPRQPQHLHRRTSLSAEYAHPLRLPRPQSCAVSC